MEPTREISERKERTPLRGKTILVTRAEHQAGEFSTALRALGADVVEIPTIRVVDPDSWDDVDRCVGNIRKYNGIIFTSINAVEKFFARVDTSTRPVFHGQIICAVGEKTQDALERYGITVTIVPDRSTADDLVAALESIDIRGKLFLFPHGSRSRDRIRTGLEKSGARVDECIVYKTEYVDVPLTDGIHAMLENRDVDLVTFFSPSSVESFFRSIRQIFPEPDSMSRVQSGFHTAVIGAVTSDALRREGITPTILPPESTTESLIDSIVRLYTV